jgi:RHS repeat-associated protein
MVAAIEHHGDARNFIFGTYLDEPLALIAVDTSETIFIKNYYHQNRLYNVAAMTDSSGNVVERYTFSAYGLPLILTGAGTDGTWGTGDDVFSTNPSASAIGNPYLYTGQRWDPETENHYYKNRYQRPTLGRFISRDPLEYVDGMNCYQYVMGNPMGAVDPLGTIVVVMAGWNQPAKTMKPIADAVETALERSLVVAEAGAAVNVNIVIEEKGKLENDYDARIRKHYIDWRDRKRLDKFCQSNLS